MLISVPSLGILFLQNHKIQTYLTAKVTGIISETLNAKIIIDKVSVTFINRFRLTGVYLEDQQGDTLLFADKMNATLRNLDRKNKILEISQLSVEESYIHFKVDTAGNINIRFILDQIIKKEDQDTSKMSVMIKNISFSQTRFQYTREGRTAPVSGINYADMDFMDLYFNLGDFQIAGDTLFFRIDKMKFREKSGFLINELHCNTSLSGKHMDFIDLTVLTPFSSIVAEELKFSFLSYRDFSDLYNLIGINFDFSPSRVSFTDISFFSSNLQNYSEEFSISGKLSGSISNLKGNNILLSYQDRTRLLTNFTIIGLPFIRTAFLNFDIKNFESSAFALESLTLPGKLTSGLNIPSAIAKLGTIRYSGKFTGYYDDFVAYGKFATGLGNFSSDILLKPDSEKALQFQGKLKADDFNLGRLIGQDSIVGRITMNATISGQTYTGGITATMDGLIDRLDLNHYDYRRIKLSGNLTDKIFDGSFSISDPNIKMDFQGKMNLSRENPEFAFTADVSRARPYYLHFDNSDPSYFASFLLETNFTGQKIDDLNGEIRIINSLFQKKNMQIQMYNFNLMAVNNADSNFIQVKSDVLDGELIGRYQFNKLSQSFRNLAGYYFPTLRDSLDYYSAPADKNNFSFRAVLKDIHPVVSFFFPEMDIGNNTEISGHYRPDNKSIALNAISPLFAYKGNVWEKVNIDSQSDIGSVTLNLKCNSMLLNNNMKIENPGLISVFRNDTSFTDLSWNSNNTPLYKGEFKAVAVLGRNPESGNPVFRVRTFPTEIIFNDTLWNISECRILIDSSSVRIDSFSLRNQNQNFMISGSISELPEDAVMLSFKDLDLSTLNVFSRRDRFIFQGRLSGTASINDPYRNLTFLSDLEMDKLIVNGEDLGKGELRAHWNNQERKIHITGSTGRGLIPGLSFEGDFVPQDRSLDFTADLDKFRINVFHTYSDFLVSDIKGLANGRLTLRGSIDKPELNGTLRLVKTSLLVDYLQTRYNFSNDIVIADNNVILKDFEVFDEKGNKALANGIVTSRYFKEYNLDIRLETENFAFLNTTEKDNNLFYGRIFAGGIIRISGPPDNLQMDINARSERNSVFFIPLYTPEEVVANDFINWVSVTPDRNGEQNPVPRYEVKMKGIRMNFNLDITPDAEVQLLFDPKVGDIIRGRGSGDLNILINTLGKFEIYGDMTIDEGDYLFTLKNVINKKFVVEKGGRISWNGDPEDANVDLKAIYSLKTSTSVLDIGASPSQSSSRKRIPVECVINMSGKLMNPTIKPDINLPGADQAVQNIVKNSVNTDEELMKQFVSLLVMNNFYSQQGFNEGGTTSTGSSVAGVTTTELLSNQVSSWLSQISNEFDIGVNYRPGDQITSDELQVALSTQILNDRISISGNLDVGGNETGTSSATTTNNIVGDFDINFKMTDKLLIKAFNRANDNLLFQTSPYTQGVGLTYKEYFNDFKDLLAPDNEFSPGKKPDEEEN